VKDVVYVSRVRVERIRGALRRATLPAEAEEILFGVHDAVADHYCIPRGGEAEHATTLDYIVAAVAGCLTGTLGAALEARHVSASEGRLFADAAGEVEEEHGVLVLKRIHVRYTLRLDREAQRERAERALAIYKDACPVFRSIHAAIAITDELMIDRGHAPAAARTSA
jgi:uncharacterized OsmC-like protein